MTAYGVLSATLPLLSTPWALPFLIVYALREPQGDQ